jgi:hypothetical protein
MALLGIEQGIISFLEAFMLHKAANADLKLHLYTNNHTPVASDTLANYTECTDTNYAPVTLTGANWNIADNGSGVSLATYPAQIWTFAGAVTIYGYYVTDAGNTKVCWAEIFSAPLNFSGGQQLTLTLNITLS